MKLQQILRKVAHEEKIHLTTSTRHYFSSSTADARTFIAAPPVINIKYSGVEIEPQGILFRRDMKVTLFPEGFEGYFFIPEKAMTV